MYDDVGFDDAHHLMRLADVGLMSLYIEDCEALAEIASELGHSKDAALFDPGLRSFAMV